MNLLSNVNVELHHTKNFIYIQYLSMFFKCWKEKKSSSSGNQYIKVQYKKKYVSEY